MPLFQHFLWKMFFHHFFSIFCYRFCSWHFNQMQLQLRRWTYWWHLNTRMDSFHKPQSFQRLNLQRSNMIVYLSQCYFVLIKMSLHDVCFSAPVNIDRPNHNLAAWSVLSVNGAWTGGFRFFFFGHDENIRRPAEKRSLILGLGARESLSWIKQTPTFKWRQIFIARIISSKNAALHSQNIDDTYSYIKCASLIMCHLNFQRVQKPCSLYFH